MKIAILTLALGDEYKEIVKYGIMTKKQYASMHSYDFIIEEKNEDCIDKTRPYAWSKLNLIQKYLFKYDFLVWIDADTFIMNPIIKIEDLISDLFPIDKDIMMVSDYLRANTGVMIFRPSPFVSQFLTQIYSIPNYSSFQDYEQGVLIHLYQTDGNIRNKVAILPVNYQSRMNSYYYNYTAGDFILHFAGCNKQALSFAMNKYCPIRKENESPEVFYKRIDWIYTKSQAEVIQRLEEDKKRFLENKYSH